ncbi:MAG: methylated-DNA--[protein]-cysteine S-methyltransferase [Desulfosarcinaceae bacterium]
MFYDYLETGLIGTLTLFGTEEGLVRLDFEKARTPQAIQSGWQRKAAVFKEVKAQLSAYFKGKLKRFDLPLAPKGTEFQQRVWRALRNIAYGELVSYGDIALAVGNPKAVRAVGAANGKNPIPIIVPCHRVIGSDGSLTGFGGGLDVKQRLIDLERGALPKRPVKQKMMF